MQTVPMAKLEKKVETFGWAFRRTRRGRVHRWADSVTPAPHRLDVRLVHQPPAFTAACSKTPPGMENVSPKQVKEMAWLGFSGQKIQK